MRAARVLALGGLASALTPSLAAACASCVSSAYGDRSFNWAYVALLIAPFGIALTVIGVLAWSFGYRPSDLRDLGATLAGRWRDRRSASPLPNAAHEETT